MKKVVRFGAFAVALMLTAAVLAPTLAAHDITVGQFVQRLAAARQLNATDETVALDSLRAVGVRLPATLRVDSRLTESAVVSISRAMGLRVTSSNPDAPFTDAQVDTFFLAFGEELLPAGDPDETIGTDTRDGDGISNGNGPPFNPFTKGKGKHKGKAKGWQSPTEPE